MTDEKRDGEQLYVRFTKTHPSIHVSRFPLWCDLKAAEKKIWNANAELALESGILIEDCAESYHRMPERQPYIEMQQPDCPNCCCRMKTVGKGAYYCTACGMSVNEQTLKFILDMYEERLRTVTGTIKVSWEAPIRQIPRNSQEWASFIEELRSLPEGMYYPTKAVTRLLDALTQSLGVACAKTDVVLNFLSGGQHEGPGEHCQRCPIINSVFCDKEESCFTNLQIWALTLVTQKHRKE